MTSVEIEASAETVWANVTAFTELPPPARFYFKLGIAHPIRAHYVGEGTDAVRYCEFSTGPFVEPITVWDEPNRLAFDVVAQPPTLEEWSPYRSVEPPHVRGGSGESWAGAWPSTGCSARTGSGWCSRSPPSWPPSFLLQPPHFEK